MRPRVSHLLGLLLAPVCAAALFSAPQKAKPPSDTIQLETILARCGDYCERLENSVLYFVCTETMRDEVFEPWVRKSWMGNGWRQQLLVRPIAKNEFVYDYQLVRKDGRTDESRTLVRENGQKRQEKNAPLKTSVYRFKNIVFGPIVLLGRAWQPKHDYQILREEEIQGRKAVVIRATPKSGEWLGYLFGTICVRKDDSSILRIEWSQESIENYGRVQKSATELGLKPDIVLIGEYGYEKNGIRFPSKFSIRESYLYSQNKKSFTSYKLNVDYGAYKFFTVETEVKY